MRSEKSAGAFRTISEVAELLDVQQHVLRFWESKFSQIQPLKRGGGRRYYRPDDVALLLRIRSLLYEEGYTIRGVQKLMKDGKVVADKAASATLLEGADTKSVEKAEQRPGKERDPAVLREIISELEGLRDKLSKGAVGGDR